MSLFISTTFLFYEYRLIIGMCFWLHLDIISSVMKNAKPLFPVVSFASSSVPTYPCGQVGYILCSSDPKTDFSKPIRSIDEGAVRYYNSSVHTAAFALPNFVKKVF